MDEHSPIFAIAVAAELASMHPQTLRQYDRLGLVSPTRTVGQSRRYSMRDVVQLREIARLSAEGLNLEGIRRILELENDVVALRSRVRELETSRAPAVASSPRGSKATWCRSRRARACRKPTSLSSGARCVVPSRRLLTVPL